MTRLRIGVPAELTGLEARGGHGKVWRRVLDELARTDEIVSLVAPRRSPRSRLRRARAPRVDVTLASGHDALPETGGPLVVEVHEAGWFDRELRAVLDPSFLAYIEERTAQAIGRADAVITLSGTARRDILATHDIAAEKVHAVWPGVDPLFHPQTVRDRRAPYVLHAAVLHPRKNLAALRGAMTKLAGEVPHHLVLVGGPPADRADWRELEAAARAELPGFPGRVEFLGEVSDSVLAGLMAGAAAFCLPSLYEGFGLPVLEAMACGTPVVVSDRGALPEVAGEAGEVVEPTDEGVARGLRHVLRDAERAAQMRRAGLERAAGRTWSRTAAGWRAVLLEAAGHTGT